MSYNDIIVCSYNCKRFHFKSLKLVYLLLNCNLASVLFLMFRFQASLPYSPASHTKFFFDTNIMKCPAGVQGILWIWLCWLVSLLAVSALFGLTAVVT